MTRPANDNFLQADVANLVAEIDGLFAAYPELAEDDDLRADMLEGSTSAYDVLRRLVNIERDADSMAKAIAERAKDLAARKTRYERKKEAMRALMLRVMHAGGLTKAPLPEATVSVGRKAPSVEIEDEASLPPRFLRVVKSPDKAAIKEALLAGKVVRGAKMGEPGETLSVRVA